MFTQWATRRLFKFLLKKRIGRYIRGDLDLDQLDVQLGSGVVQLNDVALNVDYINDQLVDLSVALKEGSLGSVTIKLLWKVLPRIEIELDEVELVFLPQKAASKDHLKNKSAAVNDYASEAQQLGLESELAGSGSVGSCTYSPVQEGVRVVANLVESLLLGMHVSVQRAIVAFEELPSPKTSQAMEKLPKEITCVSHSMLVLRVGCAEYGIDYSSLHEDSYNGEDRHGAQSLILTNAITFQQMTLELLDVLDDGCGCASTTTGGGKVFGQPVSILQDDGSLLGCIKLSIPWKSGCLDIPKLDADIDISQINLQVSGHQLQQLLTVVSSYGDCSTVDTASAQGRDTNQYGAISKNGLSGAIASEPDELGSQSKSSRSSLLPGARLISDWVHWNDRDKYTREEALSEADFAASTEEFFDCFDGTRSSQASLSGSGLWTWTCSAFSAITAASSLASGSVLISQESARQVEYDFKVKMGGVSVIFSEGNTPHKKLNAVGKDMGAVSGPGTRDQKSLVSWLSESVTIHTDYSRDDHIEAAFLDIHLSLQLSQRRLEWKMTLKQIEACEIKYQQQDDGFSHEQNGDIILETIGSSAQPLQALVEHSLPRFPVSLCEGTESVKSSAVTKKCFLRLSDRGHLAAGQVDAKHDFQSSTSDNKDHKSQGLTHIDIHFQPLIVWFDSSVICKLHKLTDIFCHPTNDLKASYSMDIGCTTRASLSSRRIVHVDMYIPSLRFLACLPHSPGSDLLKDHLLCLDLSPPAENLKRPLLNVKLLDMAQTKVDPPCVGSFTLVLRDSSLYLVSPSVNVEGSRKHVALGFNAQKVLSISLRSHEVATVEVLLRTKSAGGIWLAEQAWNGVTEQQKGGMGGRKMNSEFAATTATEVMDENNRKIREDILVCSSTYVHVTIPHVKVELFGSQHTVVLGILSSLIETSTLQTRDSGIPTLNTQHKDSSQTSISVDVAEVEIIAHPRVIKPNTGAIPPERKGNSPWGSYMIYITRFQILHVVNLGRMKSASYFWLCHENGHVKGLLADGSCGELQLLTCRDDALGRGDGGGGNALATSSAGIELSVISWPDGDHAEDMLITVTIRGCTFMAHGGRLDWLPGLITFFSQHVDKGPTDQAIHAKSWNLTAAETCLVMLQISIFETEDDTPAADNYILFSLDLHDVALCYEPGKEAVSAANLRARSMGEAQSSDMEQFAPVACAVAAAAVRVSSNAISNTASKDYEIWLRDVALLLVDTTLRRHRVLEYTPESLHQAGYVKVAGEAVMEAVVRINGEEGLQWEVECANNQLRLDTCHDTTAALGRLIAQLQQLFTPEVEHPCMDKKSEDAADAGCAGGCFGVQSIGGSTNNHVSYSNLVSSENAVIFEGVLEDAFTFVRGCSLHTDSCSCDCVDLEAKRGERFEMLGRSDLSSDDGADQSLYSSLDHLSRDGGEATDLWTPVSQNDEVPSFIEDYYVTKKSSSHSSLSSSFKDSGALLQHSQHSMDDFDLLSTVEGSGGWYDGQSFEVMENHVPVVSNRSGSKKQRGSLFHISKERLGLSLKYPQSVGRVVFQDLNLRWRLYGGSDWLVTRTKDSMELSYASQAHGGRQVGLCLEVIFNGVELQHDTFPETGFYASRLAVSIRDVRIYDCSKDAPWKKILGYHRSKSRPRESSAKALKLEIESVRPDPMVPLEEYRLSVQLLPILLHLDQRHLDFLMDFFRSSAASSSQQLHLDYEEIFSPHSGGLEGSIFDTKAFDASDEALLPFFQMCELQPFSIRVDYVPRRVDIGALRAGNYAELLNLVSWKGIELELKHVQAAGIHGWGTLSGIVVGEWLEDISCNQIHKLVQGLGPIRPLFAVGSGAAKLIALPAEHYKRDRRRLLRGMRKGAIEFLRSISLEAVGLGVQLAAGAHEILLHTESALGSMSLSSSSDRVDMPVRVCQPGDMREGLQQACESLTRGLERTASSLIGNPLKAYQRGAGTSSAVVSALRAAPSAAVAPAAAAAGAVHRALLGVRNSLDPEHRRESEEKHSGPPLQM